MATSDPAFANFSSIIFRNERNESSINVSVDFFHDLSTIMIAFKLSVPKNDNDRNYERVVIQSTLSVCKMLQGVMGDFLAKMIMENLKKYATFALKCPFAKV
jgi:hypothetical protein